MRAPAERTSVVRPLTFPLTASSKSLEKRENVCNKNDRFRPKRFCYFLLQKMEKYLLWIICQSFPVRRQLLLSHNFRTRFRFHPLSRSLTQRVWERVFGRGRVRETFISERPRRTCWRMSGSAFLMCCVRIVLHFPAKMSNPQSDDMWR